MTVFSSQHVFDKFQRDRSQIHIGLDQSVIDSLSGIGLKELAFELKVADRHREFLSWHFSREMRASGGDTGSSVSCGSILRDKKTGIRWGLIRATECVGMMCEPCITELPVLSSSGSFHIVAASLDSA